MALNCGRYAPSHEYWFGFGKPDKWNNENNKMLSVWRIPPGIEKDSDNDHPCPYPIRLVSPIISSCVFDRGCIDAYMGSGTTGVACVQQGKAFTGIERERKYFDIPAPKEADYPKILEMIEKAKANVAEEAKRKRMEIMQKELTANYWLERLRCQVLQLPPPTPLAVNTDGSIEGSLDDLPF
jgi:hypothetical protein